MNFATPHKKQTQKNLKLALIKEKRNKGVHHAQTLQAKHAGKPNTHPFILPGTPVITGKPGTTGVAGSEGAAGRPGTTDTLEATSLSTAGVAAGAAAGVRVGDCVGATRLEGVVAENDC